MLWDWLRSLSEDQALKVAAALLVLCAVAYFCSGCHSLAAVHYLPGEDGQMRAACRVWETRWIIQGETLAGCVVPHGAAPEELLSAETVPAVFARGWEHEAKGGDSVASDQVEAGRESEARTTGPALIELPVVGQSGIVLATRDDDLGIELGSVARWAIAFWGIVELGLEAIGVGETAVAK